MPIKLIPPRKDKGSKNFYLRGTYLGRFVNQSTGTDKRKVAGEILKELIDGIESGRSTRKGEPNFADAVTAYIDSGGDAKRAKPLALYFKETALRLIDQKAIDDCAAALMPKASAATRNREVYTPVSAILKRAGISFNLRRPKGAQGRVITAWLTPEQAYRIFKEADKFDPEFGILLRVLCYTGLRLGEATDRFLIDHLELADSRVLIAKTKNGSPRLVHLPPHVVAALANHPRGLDRPGETVFQWKIGYRLYKLLALTAKAAGVELPRRAAFHLFRHTYATWMRRYAGADARTLVGAGVWDNERSTNRYMHTVQSEEAKLADLLPVEKSLENAPKLKIVWGNQ